MIKLYILSTTLFLLYQKLFARFRKETLVPRWKTLIRENKEGAWLGRVLYSRNLEPHMSLSFVSGGTSRPEKREQIAYISASAHHFETKATASQEAFSGSSVWKHDVGSSGHFLPKGSDYIIFHSWKLSIAKRPSTSVRRKLRIFGTYFWNHKTCICCSFLQRTKETATNHTS